MTPSFCMIFTTTGSQEEAQRLALMLVREQLAACVQTMTISSTYTWQGELFTEPEWLLLIKTKADLYPLVENVLHEHHRYETPEITCVPITAGSVPYLAWIDEHTRGVKGFK